MGSSTSFVFCQIHVRVVRIFCSIKWPQPRPSITFYIMFLYLYKYTHILCTMYMPSVTMLSIGFLSKSNEQYNFNQTPIPQAAFPMWHISIFNFENFCILAIPGANGKQLIQFPFCFFIQFEISGKNEALVYIYRFRFYRIL